MAKKEKMTKEQKEWLRLMELAADVAILEDKKLLLELAKH